MKPLDKKIWGGASIVIGCIVIFSAVLIGIGGNQAEPTPPPGGGSGGNLPGVTATADVADPEPWLGESENRQDPNEPPTVVARGGPRFNQDGKLPDKPIEISRTLKKGKWSRWYEFGGQFEWRVHLLEKNTKGILQLKDGTTRELRWGHHWTFSNAHIPVMRVMITECKGSSTQIKLQQSLPVDP